MKKNFIKDMILVVIGMALFLVVMGIVGYTETHYTMKGEIVSIRNGNEVTVDTEDGHKWAFFGSGYSVNDTVEVTMWNGGTDLEKEDDEIQKVRILS